MAVVGQGRGPCLALMCVVMSGVLCRVNRSMVEFVNWVHSAHRVTPSLTVWNLLTRSSACPFLKLRDSDGTFVCLRVEFGMKCGLGPLVICVGSARSQFVNLCS